MESIAENFNPDSYKKLGLEILDSIDKKSYRVISGEKIFEFPKAKMEKILNFCHLDNSKANESCKVFKDLVHLSFGKEEWKMGLFLMPLPPDAKYRGPKLPQIFEPFKNDLFPCGKLPTFNPNRLAACGALIELRSRIFRYNYFVTLAPFRESVNQKARNVTRNILSGLLKHSGEFGNQKQILAAAIRDEASD